MYCIRHILIVMIMTASLWAQHQVFPRWDGKQLALNPVWARIADTHGEAGCVESVEISRDGRYVVSGAKYDYSVVMFRASDGFEMWHKILPAEIERVAWSPDGKMVAACSEDFMVRLMDAKNGDIIKEIRHNNGIDGLTFSHDGKFMASGEEISSINRGSGQSYLTLFSMPQADVYKRINFAKTINSIDFSADDAYVLAAGHSGRLVVYKSPSLEPVREFICNPESHLVTGRFSPDMKLIACGDNNGDYFIWDFESGELIKRFNRSGHKVEIVDWTPDGKYLATAGNDPFIRFFRTADILSGERIYTALQVHAGDQTEYLDFSTTGAFMASAHHDGLIRLWAVIGEDAGLNERLHRELSQKQAEEAEKMKKKTGDSGQ